MDKTLILIKTLIPTPKAVRALRRGAPLFWLFLFFVLLPASAFPANGQADAPYAANEPGADSPERVLLNADRVSYNDETGQASAQGRAVLTHQGMTIRAERIDYDAQTQKVQAMPLPGEKVVLTGAGRSLSGDRLDYDLMTREGVFFGAGTNVGVGEGTLYIYGGEIEVLPWDAAVARGLVRSRRGSPEDYVAHWRNVTMTTCAQDHPHYRLESRSISFIPGRSVVARKPRVYLGNTYLFTFPMDYIVQIQRRALKYSVVPYVQQRQTHGTGGGLTGSLAWDTGSLTLGVALWSEVGAEGLIEAEQELGGGLSILGGVSYSWDEVGDERLWRPYAALTYAKDGWRAALRWSRNEYISDQKDSLYKYKGRLDRRPELTVQSPWFRTSSWSWLNLTASWGAYREEVADRRGEVTNRYGLGAHSYFEKALGENVEFFSDTVGNLWFYDRDNADQQMLTSFTGLRYRLGAFEMGTAYERRYTWGEGAMLWDQYRERERIHQRLRFPLGREVFAAFRGSYDLDESMVDEVQYALQWVTDCMKWELRYIDDRTSGNDDSVGLSLTILAFPDTPASFGQVLLRDPFDRPRDLPKD